MKQILTFVTKLLPKHLPGPMGRWRIEKCHKKMNHKIDLSNEDHCGPCGQYALEKIEQKQSGDNLLYLSDKDVSDKDVLPSPK